MNSPILSGDQWVVGQVAGVGVAPDLPGDVHVAAARRHGDMRVGDGLEHRLGGQQLHGHGGFLASTEWYPLCT